MPARAKSRRGLKKKALPTCEAGEARAISERSEEDARPTCEVVEEAAIRERREEDAWAIRGQSAPVQDDWWASTVSPWSQMPAYAQPYHDDRTHTDLYPLLSSSSSDASPENRERDRLGQLVLPATLSGSQWPQAGTETYYYYGSPWTRQVFERTYPDSGKGVWQ